MNDNNPVKERIKVFFIKIISVKIIFWFGSATIAFFLGILPWYGWLIVSGMCFASRTTEKLLMKYFENRGNDET